MKIKQIIIKRSLPITSIFVDIEVSSSPPYTLISDNCIIFSTIVVSDVLDKMKEVNKGIKDMIVHAENYAITLSSFQRRAEWHNLMTRAY